MILSRKFATPLSLEIAPSRIMGVWLMLTHTVPLLAWPLLPLPAWQLAPLAAGAGFSLWWHWRRHVVRVHRDAIRQLHWGADRDCRLRLASGRQAAATLLPQAVVLRWLVILHLRGPGRQLRHLVILPDMLPSDRFRQLRVRLRIALQQAGD